MKDEKIEIGEGTKTNPFFTLQWHITERCNLQCKHCYQNENYIEEEMGFKKKIELIDKFVYFCSKIGKKPRISFTGGEPFAIKDELYSLLDYCNKKYPSIKKSVLTNGTLIKEEDISLLKNFNLDYIQISLDGGTQKTHDLIRGKGNFERAVSSLCLLKKGGIKTAVMNVFHRKNYKEIPLLIGLCDKLEVDALGITELVPIGRGSEIRSLSLNPLEVKELFMQIAKKQADLINKNKKLRIDMKRPLWVLIKNEFPELKNMIGGGCAAGFSGLAMLPNGDIMPCRRMCYTIGNIKEQTFFEIWYSSNVLWELRERDKLGECANCENNKFCGGCKAVSLASKGSYLKTDPQCWFKYGAV